MFNVAICMKNAQFVTLLYPTAGEMNEGLGQLSNLDLEYRWKNKTFEVSDPYGMRALINGDEVSSISIEDMDQTKRAFIERQMHQARTTIELQQILQNDPKVKAHQMMHGAPVMMGGPFPNMGNQRS